MKMEQSVPKRRHIKFRRRVNTQKKTYNIQNNGESMKSRMIQGCPRIVPSRSVFNFLTPEF